MSNFLLKTIAYHKQARLLLVDPTAMIQQQACTLSSMAQPVHQAFIELLTAASLCSGLLKDDQQMSIRVKASNRKQFLFAECNAAGHIRGYVSEPLRTAVWENEKQPSVPELFGPTGCIQVVKDIGMSRTFTGMTDMPYDTIAANMSHYFQQSEQTPTLFVTAICTDETTNTVVRCRGVAAQLLPGAPPSLLRHIRRTVAATQQQWGAARSDEAVDNFPRLFEQAERLRVDPVQWHCDCSQEMFYPMLYALGIAELTRACEQQQTISFVCHRCGTSYAFPPAAIAQLLPPQSF